MQKIKNNIPYQFTNESNQDEHVMVISGAIGEGGWFYDATSAQDVRNALDGVDASTIRIKINSPGGSAFDGIEIRNYLKDLKAHVIVEITALAASAASIIAMGADEIVMRTGSTLMIHEASTIAYGTKTDIQKTMNALEAIDESLVDIYVEKTGLSRDEIRDMIVAETWFTAEQALEKGFVDRIESIQEPTQDNKIDESVINSIVERVTAELKMNIQKEESERAPQHVAAQRKRFLF